MRRRRGFTLVESVLTLAIVVIISVLPVMQFRNVQQKMLEATFFQQFNQQWEQARLLAVTRHQAVLVHFQTNYVRFYSGQSGWQWERYLTLPTGLRVAEKTLQISTSGQTSPQTLYFKSDYFNRFKTIKPQMGWGDYDET